MLVDAGQNNAEIRSKGRTQKLHELVKVKLNNKTRETPLSYGQRALWFVYKNSPKSCAYNVAISLKFGASLNLHALQMSLQYLLDTHPQLRANISESGGEPKLLIPANRQMHIDNVDAGGLSERELKKAAEEYYQRAFKLEEDCLVRACVFNRANGEQILLLVIHHIVFDGWSMWMLQDELGGLYAALSGNRQPTTKQEISSHEDFLSWQSDYVNSKPGKKSLAYWRAKLSGVPEMHNLATDFSRPDVQTFSGNSLEFVLGKSIASRVKELCRQNNVTVYTYLLAVFMVLLRRHANQEDIVVGSPVTARATQGFQDIIGYIANLVVIRQQIDNKMGFQELLSQLQETVYEALENQYYPFPLLVEKLQPKRNPRHSPLFQVTFAFQKSQTGDDGGSAAGDSHVGKWGNVAVTHFPVSQQEGQFDLELEIVDINDEFKAIFKYNKDLFLESTISEFKKHYVKLLESSIDKLTRPVYALDLIDEEEKRALLPAISQDSQQCSDTLISLFEQQCLAHPHHIAVNFGQQSLTYAQLRDKSNQLGRYLMSITPSGGGYIGMCLDRSEDLVVAVLAILKSGNAYIPLDPNVPVERLKYIVEDAGMSAIIADDTMRNNEGLKNIVTESQCRLVDLQLDAEQIAAMSKDSVDVQLSPGDDCYVIYTSGSTGNPKGVLVTHENVVRLFSSTRKEFDFSDKDVWTLFHSIAFDFSVWEFWGALLHGGRLVVVPYDTSRSPKHFRNLLKKEAVTVLNQTPSAFQQLVNEDMTHGDDKLDSLRCVIFGGEALKLERLRPWVEKYGDRSPELINMYGITETTVHVTYRRIMSADLRKKQSVIGRAISDLSIYLLDDNLQPVPIGVPGEIHVSGPGVSKGYLNRPDITKERFIPNPYLPGGCDVLYKSGDLGRHLKNGDIEYIGRIDHQIKLRGFRIELGDIESQARKFPKITDAVCIIRGEGENAKILLYYISADDKLIDTRDLRSFLLLNLPTYSIPSAFVKISSIPMTGNNKLDVDALPDDTGELQGREHDTLLPRSDLEIELLNIWKNILNIHNLSILDNFFDVGGHSLLAVRLMAEVETKFGVSLPISSLFQYGTVEQMSQCIEKNESEATWSPLVGIHPQGSKPPLFCIPGGGGNVVYFYGFRKYLGDDQPIYALQSIGLDGEQEPLYTAEEIAQRYLEYVVSVQEHGPYYLCGHCVGAHIAFEIAHLLKSRGEEVAFIGVIDAPGPVGSQESVTDTVADTEWVAVFLSILQQSSLLDLNFDKSEISSLSEEDQLHYLKGVLQDSNFLPPAADIKHVRGLVNVFKANSKMKYAPDSTRKNHPELHIFKAQEYHVDYDFNRKDPYLGWGPLATNELKVHEVQGNHITMMLEPNVADLASRIGKCLSGLNKADSNR